MKRAFTLVELLISISLLAMIMVIVSSIFAVAIKNYRSESQKSFMQKEINFAIDNIGKDIKLAAEVPSTYDTFTRSAETLILALPAVNEEEDFLYSGGVLLKDVIIYYKDGSTIKKKTYPSAGSKRSSGETSILTDVSGFAATYLPELTTRQVTVAVGVSRSIGKSNVSLSATTTGRLRNK